MINSKKNNHFIEKKETPLIKQYNNIKIQYPDTILLFQVGDFYETFGKDAVLCSKTLNIVLTKRSKNGVYLAGFPCHSINNYLPKLIRSGFRVAICNQLEEAKKGKNIVKRGVVELMTPGTTMNEHVIKHKFNNFLASIFIENNIFGLSFVDISTGEFFTIEDNQEIAIQYINNFNPSEILIQKKYYQFFNNLFQKKYHIFLMEDYLYNYSFAYEKLVSHFQTNSLKGFGIHDLKLGIIASGIILFYLYDTLHFKIKHISNIKRIKRKNFMYINDYTFRNLEILKSFDNEGVSLIQVLDHTITPMGYRLLKKWIVFPLLNIFRIKKRYHIIQELCIDDEIRIFIINKLKNIPDIERIISKIALENISPKEMFTLHQSINYIKEIRNKIIITKNKHLIEIGKTIQDCDEISKKIITTIYQYPPYQIEKGKGNVIIEGVSKELDDIRLFYFSQKEYLNQLCSKEQRNSGISNLKIKFHKIYGYFFEIKNKEKQKIPKHWIQKQKLSNCERYLTEDLKNYELQILNAEQTIFLLEKKIFSTLIRKLLNSIKKLQNNATILAELDVYCSFSSIAIEKNYIKPVICESSDIRILGGRHPVIECQFISKNSYIPNDIYLNKKNQQILMITGPNMSGKSAILRQTAIIILMAHIGSFVPAQYAKIGLTDKIFSRVGGYDNISLGESTFMVEMNETANILNNITEKSFILLDEIGRGTNTYDGISIAQSIIEFLHENKLRPLTLFSTHYHELNNIPISLKRVKNYHISTKKIKNNIIFMRKLIPGSCDNSLGIYVAKMAGIPIKVISRAEHILQMLKNKRISFVKKEKKSISFMKKIQNFFSKKK
ncbi:DNA mismatch repair protein MutS [Blattabacterium cuenoti]|uniref:DNA mismatch repair protein MutS n=1 Tax=Blattabacterium cuenoti TaxID=1653831 RepID=UPI00163D1F03|nr:DNA mismatch repair protein MutS [Blattabacterium cuenoti]